MRILHRLSLASLAAALLAAALLAAAAPLHAQPFDSDVTGPIVTGSGVSGMGYPVVPVRDIENALFRDVNGRSAFRSRAIADAVLSSAAEAQRAACAGTLQPPPDWPDSALTPPVEAQRIVCGLLARHGMDSEEARRTLAALRGGRPGTPGDAAEVLVQLLAGLGTQEMTFVDERQRFVAAGRWEEVLAAYDAYLDAVPDDLMDPPPGELVVIGILLDRAVDAGLAAAER